MSGIKVDLRKQSSIKGKVGQFTEPTFVVRSDKNTYLTVAERGQVDAWRDNNSPITVLLQDIMLRTRAQGLCVEAYF